MAHYCRGPTADHDYRGVEVSEAVKDRYDPFHTIEEQGKQTEHLPLLPPYIGGADITAALLPDILFFRDIIKIITEGYGSDQISKEEK